MRIPKNRPRPSPSNRMSMTGGSVNMPDYLASLPDERRVDLDVRDDLRNGREPFSRIMAARESLPQGGVLRLRATFEPFPLYAVMGKHGYDHWTEELGPDDWRVSFYPRAAPADEAPATAPAAAQAAAPSSPAGEGPEGDDIVILDVRGMEPPEPMVHTLAALERLPRGQTLLQINERVPRFLLPRLGELGFTHEIVEQAEGVVRVFIRHRPEPAS